MSLSVVALLLVASGLQAIEGAFIAKTDVTYESLTDKLDSFSPSACVLKFDMRVSLSLDMSLNHETTMRVSKALNILAEEKSATNYRIQRAEANRAGDCSSVGSGGINSRSGEQYIYEPDFFRCFLEGVWGSPTDVPAISSVKDKKGLLIFNGCAAMSRVEPWDGANCRFEACGETQFTDCKVVFYELTAA